MVYFCQALFHVSGQIRALLILQAFATSGRTDERMFQASVRVGNQLPRIPTLGSQASRACFQNTHVLLPERLLLQKLSAKSASLIRSARSSYAVL